MTLSTRKIGRTDLEVSSLGIGGGPFGNLFAKVADADVRQVIRDGAAAGVRLFDTSPFYGFGLSERRVGDALRELPRRSFALSTKVGRLLTPLRDGPAARQASAFDSPMPFDAVFDYSYDGVMRSYEASLQRLGLAQIDILLFHDLAQDMHDDAAYAHHFRIAMESGMRAATELRDAGLVKAIGLGVNRVEPCLGALAHGDPDVFLLASRLTLLEQETAEPLLEACQRRQVSIIAGAPFNSGILVTGAKSSSTYDHAPAPTAVVQRVAELEASCAAHGVPLPAAALQFPLRHPVVAAVLPGVRNQAELASALRWAQMPIPDGFWDDLIAAGLVLDL